MTLFRFYLGKRKYFCFIKSWSALIRAINNFMPIKIVILFFVGCLFYLIWKSTVLTLIRWCIKAHLKDTRHYKFNIMVLYRDQTCFLCINI